MVLQEWIPCLHCASIDFYSEGSISEETVKNERKVFAHVFNNIVEARVSDSIHGLVEAT